MTVDALHDLQNHRLPSLHPYEVVQSRVELVRHLTRKVVKPVEPCDGKDLTGEEKEKKNQFQSSRQCYRIIQKWSSSNGRQTHACQKTKTKRGKENQNFSVSVVVKQKPDKRVRTIRFFSHLFLSTFYDSRLHRPHNIESRSSACPQRVLLYVQQQQQAIYDINK